MPQTNLDAKREAVLQAVLEHVERNDPLLVLKAPPGSGKTFVTTHAVALASFRNRRVAVATQTNAQADDFCARMARDFPKFEVCRFIAGGATKKSLGQSVVTVDKAGALPVGAGVVVATSAKWMVTDMDKLESFDVLFIDEAWQMCWADFMLMGNVASRFVLVGDPGQIPPVVPIDVSRWQTSRRPPHVPAPTVILRDHTLPTKMVQLPVSTRLPYDTCEMVRAFYDFVFESWATATERRLTLDKAIDPTPVDTVLDRLTTGSVVLATLPTPEGGPALEEDLGIARAAARMARRILERNAVAQNELGAFPIAASDIGITATHRVLNTRITEALGDLSPQVRVDTPERWQGLERRVMIAVHPLSGVVKPSVFDLSTGRLCVMTSRHNTSLILLSRDHVGTTLDEYLPTAEQAVGLPDEAGRGKAQNLAVWRYLETKQRRVDIL